VLFRSNSSALGSVSLLLTTNAGAGGVITPPTAVTATNDSFTFPEDSPTQILNLLANDLNATGGTVTLVSTPRLGTATVNADGTVSFTPNLNANGADSFSYTVTAGTQVSNIASVTLSITPVNDPPTAVNDTAGGVVNQPIAINVLANDTDPDGTADLANAVLVTPPAAGATVTGGVGGTFSFTATATGTYNFTYQAQDKAGALSANTATVTVVVAAAETLSITAANYTTNQSRLKVAGTVSPATVETLTLQFVSSTGTVLGTAGTTATAANGTWAIDIRGIVLPTGATAVKVTSPRGTIATSALTVK
jgi:hypothetical protein